MPRKPDPLADLKRMQRQQAREQASAEKHALKLARISEIAAVKLHAKLQERAAMAALSLRAGSKRGTKGKWRTPTGMSPSDLVSMRDGPRIDDRSLRAIGILLRLFGCFLIVGLMVAIENC